GFFTPAPTSLIRDGKLLRRNMRKELITKDELMALLREEGVEHVSEVKRCCMEVDGNLSVIKYDR
ncbi:MAG TPA: YetF domain-containing protein, partial [Pirellulales bacterium]